MAEAVTSLDVSATLSDNTASIKINGNSAASGTPSTVFLTPGSNLINIVATAQDGVTVNTYQVSVNRASSINVDLAGLTLSSGGMDQGFNAGLTAYSQSVASGVSSVMVTPTVADASSTVTVNGNAVNSGSASSAISLSEGSNAITVVVTGSDATTTKTYTITIDRASAFSSNANLSGLTISSGTLSPIFSADTLSYNTAVANDVISMTVTPTLADSNASVLVNGVSAANAVNLNVGSNTINVVVTAENGSTTKTYTVAVTRQGSTNTNLSALTASTGAFDQAFSSAVTSYSQTVAFDISSLTVTPTVENSESTVTVNDVAVTSGFASDAIALATGPNAINVTVTAGDGVSQKNYVINVTRQGNNDADLTSLIFSSGALTPTFSSATTTYTQSVPYATSNLTVTPTLSDNNASGLQVNTADVVSGQPSGNINLNVGDNVINTVVVAEDGVTSKTYAVTVNRTAASTDNNLSALTISSGTLTPAFSTGTISYSASVTNEVASIDITATANDSKHESLTIDGAAATSAVAKSVALDVGANAIDVVVTAEDLSTKTYTITVTRAAPAVVKTVCSSGCDYTTIQSAINGVAADTIIEVANGSYAEALTIGSKNITLKSQNGAAAVTLTGDGTDTPVVTFNGADTSVLDGFTIDNSYVDGCNSRGIYITASASPMIQNVIVSGNSLYGSTNVCMGGGIKAEDNTTGTITLHNSTVSNNGTRFGAGGIVLENSTMDITGVTHIDNNTVQTGSAGGIWARYSSSLNISASGVATSTINGNQPSGSGKAAGILFDGGAGSVFSIENITLDSNYTDGTSGHGGAISIYDIATTATVKNVHITNNTARLSGAGILVNNAHVNVINSVIEGNVLINQAHGAGMKVENQSSAVITDTHINSNQTNGRGAGFYMTGGGVGTLTISGSTFNNNGPVDVAAGYGAGIYLESISGTANISDSTINGNTAQWGGGLYANNTVLLDMDNVEINNNTATSYAGGIWLHGGTSGSTLNNVTINGNTAQGSHSGGMKVTEDVVLSNAFVQGNKAVTDGGGISVNDGSISNTVISGNTVTTNSAGNEGGGIFMGSSAGVLTLNNVTVTSNSSYDYAGMYVNGGTVNVNNSIFYGNVAYQTGDPLDDQLRNSGTVTVNYSIIQDGWVGAGANNLSDDPAFVDMQQPVGTTPTTAGDYRVCVDANTPAASCPDAGVTYPSVALDSVVASSAPQASDVRGYFRAADLAGVGNDSSDYYDRGAYEYQSGNENYTNAGAATAVKASTTSIAVNMPYSGDANGDNTYTVEYKLTTVDTWTTWVSNATHAASPYSTTITGLVDSASYDVSVTYHDTDGVGGDDVQRIIGVSLQ